MRIHTAFRSNGLATVKYTDAPRRSVYTDVGKIVLLHSLAKRHSWLTSTKLLSF